MINKKRNRSKDNQKNSDEENNNEMEIENENKLSFKENMATIGQNIIENKYKNEKETNNLGINEEYKLKN